MAESLLHQLQRLDRTSEYGTQVISLVGAGGKSSLLYGLINELNHDTPHGYRIGTTTTMMYDPSVCDNMMCYPFDDILPYSAFSPLADGDQALFIYGRKHESLPKVYGITPNQVDALSCFPWISYIISESDGAHRLPVKAPDSNEPQHPASTTVVIGLIGLSSYRMPMDGKTIHRFELFQKISPVRGKNLIDEHTYIDLIMHKDGLFKSTPVTAKRVLFLNQADLMSEQDRIRIMQALAHQGIPVDLIVMASLRPLLTIYHTYFTQTRCLS